MKKAFRKVINKILSNKVFLSFLNGLIVATMLVITGLLLLGMGYLFIQFMIFLASVTSTWVVLVSIFFTGLTIICSFIHYSIEKSYE